MKKISTQSEAVL